MAASKGMPHAHFRAQYVEPLPGVSDAFRLRVDHQTSQCSLLLANGKCSVHEARPAACRTYPFWPENLVSPYEWAREAALCEGIASPFVQGTSGAERPEPPVVQADEVEKELLIEELRTAGALAAEDWSHAEAKEHISTLREMGQAEDLALEPMAPPREVLLHDLGLVVLETPDEWDDADGWATRSLHFDASLGNAQTEVRVHRASGTFDHSALCFSVHRAFRAVLTAAAPRLDLSAGVAILGGGGGALAMGLRATARESAGQALAALGVVHVVERDAHVASLAQEFFGFDHETEPGLRLSLVDAAEFIELHAACARGTSVDGRGLAAAMVDIAGPELGRQGDGLSPVLLPPKDPWLSPKFAGQALAATVGRGGRNESGGVVAWNILIADNDAGRAELRAAARAVVAGVGPHVDVWALGPEPVGSGAQWLLCASASDVVAEHILIEALRFEDLAHLQRLQLADI